MAARNIILAALENIAKGKIGTGFIGNRMLTLILVE